MGFVGGGFIFFSSQFRVVSTTISRNELIEQKLTELIDKLKS